MEAWSYSLTFIVIYFNQHAGGVSDTGITMLGCKEGWIYVTEENNTVITCHADSPTQPMEWTVENDVRNQTFFEGSCDPRPPARCNPSANNDMSLQIDNNSQTSLVVYRNHRLYDGSTMTCSQNSSHVNCRMKVMYGPQSVRISPSVARPFVTNGTAHITLTCKADDVYPAVTYSWSGVTCVNKKDLDGTCMFTPRVPEDEGHEVWCTARNTVSGIQKKENYFIQLNYPPTSPPEITTRDVLTAGEHVTLTCTVKGGKPKVTSVTFFCGDEADKSDVVGNVSVSVSVSSSIVIRVQPRHNNTVCQCSATWDRQPDLYPYKTFTSLYVQEGVQPSITSLTLNRSFHGAPTVKDRGNQSVILACSAIAIPEPTMRLTKIDSSGNILETLKNATSRYLQYNVTSFVDCDIFRCDVTNVKGRDKKDVTLRAECHSPSQETQSVRGIVAGVTAAIVVIIILTVSLAIVIRRRRNRSRALSQNSDEKNKERNEFEEQVNMIYVSADIMNSNQPTIRDSPHLPHSTNPYFPFEELTQPKASNSSGSSTAQATTQPSLKDPKGESEELNTEHDYSVVNDGFFGK